jgi:uncharacterized membrane protein
MTIYFGWNLATERALSYTSLGREFGHFLLIVHVTIRTRTHAHTLVTLTQALEQGQSLIIPKDLQIKEYAKDGPLSPITPNVIYVPELTNQVALDSFIVMNDLLYIFQFTISKEHGIKLGLIDLLMNILSFHLWTTGVSYSSSLPSTS